MTGHCKNQTQNQSYTNDHNHNHNQTEDLNRNYIYNRTAVRGNIKKEHRHTQ